MNNDRFIVDSSIGLTKEQSRYHRASRDVCAIGREDSVFLASLAAARTRAHINVHRLLLIWHERPRHEGVRVMDLIAITRVWRVGDACCACRATSASIQRRTTITLVAFRTTSIARPE